MKLNHFYHFEHSDYCLHLYYIRFINPKNSLCIVQQDTCCNGYRCLVISASK